MDYFDGGRRGEVAFSNHKHEFYRFFDKHKRFCDEISGLKFHSVGGLVEDKRVVIGRENFILGIRSLDSFITEFICYVYELPKKNLIKIEFDNLQNDFLNDLVYQDFIKRVDNLGVDDDVLFTKFYLGYLRRCFDISYLLSRSLQSSLNISTKEIVKNLQFVNYDAFFNNLSSYKEEVALMLANSGFSNLFVSFKKLLGFFYTYRYLVALREQKHILFLFDCVFDYMVKDDNIRLLIRLKDVGLNSFDRVRINKDFVVIRRAFNMIFELVNRSLQLKNILPKPSMEVLVDNTLI